MKVWKWKEKTIKIRIPSHFPVITRIVSVCQKKNADRKGKKEERKKGQNTDRIQAKLNAPHVRYNVKILPQ